MTCLQRIALALLLLLPSLEAFGQQVWSFDEYAALEARIADADLARAAAPAGSPAHVEATRAAYERRDETLRYLNDWIASGELAPEFVEHARGARLVLMQNLALLAADLGRCAESRSLVLAIEDMRLSEDDEWRAGFATASEAAASCVVPGLAAPEREPEATEPTDAPPAPAANSERAAAPAGAVALVGVGLAAAAGGLAWNLALLDDKAEHERLRDDCDAGGGCRAARANQLADRIDSGRVPIGAMIGVGLATTAAGAVWWAAADRRHDEPRAAVWAPQASVGRDGAVAGAVVRW